MGINIHKSMGYAIKGLKNTKRKGLIDDRIDPLGYLGPTISWRDRETTWTQDGFLRFCKNRMDESDYFFVKSRMIDTNGGRYRWDPQAFVLSDAEYGIPGVVMIIPPECSNHWSRYDNVIDYYEHQVHHPAKGAVNDIQFLDVPLFPFHGYMDARTGKRYRNEKRPEAHFANDFWFEVRSARELLKGKRKRMFTVSSRLNADRLGFKNTREAKKHIAPILPQSVIALAQFLNLFINDETIWQLRPAIYTYWS